MNFQFFGKILCISSDLHMGALQSKPNMPFCKTYNIADFNY